MGFTNLTHYSKLIIIIIFIIDSIIAVYWNRC